MQKQNGFSSGSVGISAINRKVESKEPLPLADQFREPGYTHIEEHQLIPSDLPHHTVHRKVENLLKLPDSTFRLGTENGIHRRDLGNSGIILADAVEFSLDYADLRAPRAQAERSTRVRGTDILYRGIHDKLDIVSVITAQNGYAVQPLEGELLAAPLGEAVTGGSGPVAEFGRQRFCIALAADVVVEKLIHDAFNVLKNISAPDKFLIHSSC